LDLDVHLPKAMMTNALVVGFVVLDVFLITAAARHVSASPAVDPDSVSFVTQRPISPTPSTSVSIAPRPMGDVGYGLLSLSSTTDGWRAHAGCRVPARLAATADGGRTWHRMSAPVAHVLRIDMTGPGAGWLVGSGGDAGCVPVLYSTTDGGSIWSASTGLGQAWVPLGSKLRLPSGTTTAPCGSSKRSLQIAPADITVALVVCADQVLATSDGGLTWMPTAAFPDGGRPVAAALEAGGGGRGVALVVGAAGCETVEAVPTDDAGETWTSGTCLPHVQAPASIAIDAMGAGLVLSPSGLMRTTDGGRSWS
jgi:photosystem II stability/assembly factor-like uncharacterized protein